MRDDRKRPRGDGAAIARDDLLLLSRRDFIRLNSSLILLAGTSSCSWPEEPVDDRTEFRIVRAADLLTLRFELRNLRIVHFRNRPSKLVRIRPGEDALLRVGFPGQSAPGWPLAGPGLMFYG